MNKTQGEAPSQNKDSRNLLVQLKEVQGKHGCIPDESIIEIARSSGTSVSDVYGVATFYSFLSRKQLGRNIIRVCKSLPCYLKHSEMIIKSVEDEIGIRPGETTQDRRFSFELTNCIGACDMAPAMLVNNDVHGDLTPERISQILKEYK